MKSTVMLSALLLALMGLAHAFWRLECHGVAGIALMDPIVDLGKVAGHMHTIKGGSAFSESSTADDLLLSNCSSCQVKQDKSAYWAPQLYFMAKNGTTYIVPEVAGHLTYYKYIRTQLHNGSWINPEAMPNGLRIISGDMTRRNFSLQVPDPPLPWTGNDATQDSLAQKAIGFNCLNYASGTDEATLFRHNMPNKTYLDANCPDGLRLEIVFPHCWNGSLDSVDHKSHMAFANNGNGGGQCPEGYDRIVSQILFETIYPVHNYVNDDGYFALSMGDPTGYGYHADLLIAWEDGVLAKAIDICGPNAGIGLSGDTSLCPVFDINPVADQASCRFETAPSFKQNIETDLKALPGNNPIQSGPQPATKAAAAGSAATNPGQNLLVNTPAPTPPALASISLVPLPLPVPTSSTSAVLGPYTTVYSTSGNVVWEQIMVQTEVTVFVTAPAAPSPSGPSKRAAHAHRHGKKHGLRA